MALTDGAGVDVANEAVGVPGTFTIATEIVRPGGHVANIDVHRKEVALHLDSLWIRNLVISMGLVNTNMTPILLMLVESKKLSSTKMVTHCFNFAQFPDGYDTFSRATETMAIKVINTR